MFPAKHSRRIGVMRILYPLAFVMVFGGLLLDGMHAGNVVLAQANSPTEGERPGTVPPPEPGESRIYLPFISDLYRFYLPQVPVGNTAPAIRNPFPTADARGQSLNAYLAWKTDRDVEGDAVSFQVYLEAGDTTPDELIGTTDNSFLEPPFTFELDTEYHWQVIAVDARGARRIGPVWSFSTEDLPYPPPLNKMIRIPAGEFLMGCDSGNPNEIVCKLDEEPLHRVYLDAFEIDKYETTNAEYRACVAAGVCSLPRRFNSRHREHYYFEPEFDYHPVLYVSWWDAQTYCAWEGKRLLTEAEWEKAARGTVDTRIYPWGNEPLDCTRAAKNSDNEHCLELMDTLPVGSIPLGASPYGVMDVAGNAFEWVNDLYDKDYYWVSPYENPPGSDVSNSDWQTDYEGPLFVIRGGSNMDNWWYVRTAHRHFGHHSDDGTNDSPHFRTFRVGFRCGRSVDDASATD